MRAIVSLIALASAASTPVALAAPSQPWLERQAPSAGSRAPAQTSAQRVCADRIQQVRAERGLPPLHSDSTASSEPLLIRAVDRRVDGCPVMVMAHDGNDVRPVPTGPGQPRVRKVQ